MSLFVGGARSAPAAAAGYENVRLATDPLVRCSPFFTSTLSGQKLHPRLVLGTNHSNSKTGLRFLPSKGPAKTNARVLFRPTVFVVVILTLLGLQSRFGDKPLKF